MKGTPSQRSLRMFSTAMVKRRKLKSKSNLKAVYNISVSSASFQALSTLD